MGHKIPEWKPKSKKGEEATAGQRPAIDLRQRTYYAGSTDRVEEILNEWACPVEDINRYLIEFDIQRLVIYRPKGQIPVVIRKRG